MHSLLFYYIFFSAQGKTILTLLCPCFFSFYDTKYNEQDQQYTCCNTAEYGKQGSRPLQAGEDEFLLVHIEYVVAAIDITGNRNESTIIVDLDFRIFNVIRNQVPDCERTGSVQNTDLFAFGLCFGILRISVDIGQKEAVAFFKGTLYQSQCLPVVILFRACQCA